MIGVFDSGSGGLSVWRELILLKPFERYLYISDAAFCPYGPKDPKEIIARSVSISNFLIKKGANLIVIACNTATAAAVETLRKKFKIPFVGMEPAVKPAAINTKTGVIGVLATKGTFKGSLYLNTSQRYAHDIKVIETVGEGLVEIVEQGRQNTPKAEALVRSYIEPMIEQGADTVVLGCTHYPFLTPIIEKIADGRLKIINPAPAVAKRAAELLDEAENGRGTHHDEEKKAEGENIIATTGKSFEVLKDLAGGILSRIAEEGKLNKEQLQPFYNQKFVNLNPDLDISVR